MKRELGALSPPAVVELLAALEGEPAPIPVFLCAYTRGDPKQWKPALACLAMLDISYTRGWASGFRRKRVAALASEPRAVEAFQAACVAIDVSWPDAFAVLACEGSDASADALMPHFVRAAHDRDCGLDDFKKLKVYAAKTKPMTRMLGEVSALFDATPVLALVQRLEIGPLKVLTFGGELRAPDGSRASVFLDNRSSPGFSLSLEGSDVALASIDDIPRLLAATPWNWATAGFSSNVKGKKRDRIVEWLTTGK